MARYNKYQYETSPRKFEPDYTPTKKKKVTKKSTSKKPVVTKNKKTRAKATVKEMKRQKARTIIYIIIGFAILFAISYRNSQIDESFAKVQDLKQEMLEVEKENEQLEVSIENSMNLNNLEQQAKEVLGMNKINNKQTIYVDLPKSDYIEPASEEVIIEEKMNIFESIMEVVTNIFK